MSAYEDRSPASACRNYGKLGKEGLGFCGGHRSHSNSLRGPWSVIDTAPLKIMGCEQIGHLGHGLYIEYPARTMSEA